MTIYDLRNAQKEIRDGKPTIEEIKKEYWQKVYQTVDPFRKKSTKKPIEEFVVYMDEDSFEDFWNWFERYLK